MLFLLQGCFLNDPELKFSLPAQTQEGKNTIGFLLNWSVWVNYGKQCFFVGGCQESLESAFYFYQNGSTLLISALQAIKRKRKHEVLQNFDISLDNISTTGDYLIDGRRHDDRVAFTDELKLYSLYLIDSTKAPFRLSITKIDTVEKVISGNFEGILYNHTIKQDSIIITEGRFDLKID